MLISSMKIIKINLFTIYFLFILFISGYIKVGLIIFFIVIMHELGHIITIKLLKYKIIECTIYPFGGITKVEKDLNTPVNKEMLIAISGIAMQIIWQIIVFLMPLSEVTKNLFYKYNLSIMFFNILPIIPLDGSIIFKSILNKLFSFKNSYLIHIIVSFISIILYILFNYWYSLNNYFIIMLFIYKTIECIRNYKYIFNRFLLERYLNKYNFKSISTKVGNLNILKIDTYQYFKDKEKIVSEEKKLQEKFDNSR